MVGGHFVNQADARCFFQVTETGKGILLLDFMLLRFQSGELTNTPMTDVCRLPAFFGELKFEIRATVYFVLQVAIG